MTVCVTPQVLFETQEQVRRLHELWGGTIWILSSGSNMATKEKRALGAVMWNDGQLSFQ